MTEDPTSVLGLRQERSRRSGNRRLRRGTSDGKLTVSFELSVASHFSVHCEPLQTSCCENTLCILVSVLSTRADLPC